MATLLQTAQGGIYVETEQKILKSVQAGIYVEIGQRIYQFPQAGIYAEILQSIPFIDTEVPTGPDDSEEAGDGTGFDSGGDWVTIESSITAANRKNSAFRFIDIDLPTGATLISAVLLLQAYDATDDNMSADIYGEDADNSESFTTNPNINNRTKTDTMISWSIDNTGTTTIQSPNIKNIIQEIQGRDGWTSGNAITILVFGKKTGNKKEVPKSKRAILEVHGPYYEYEYECLKCGHRFWSRIERPNRSTRKLF